MTVNSISKAGDVQVKKIEVVNNKGFAMNITNQIVDIHIFEDLFSPFLTGNVRVVDAVDIASLMPLVGEERINIEIQTPGLPDILKQQFYIYKITDRDNVGDSNVFYTLHFMSLEGIVDANKKLSQAFQGRYSEIAKMLLGKAGLDTKKPVLIEDTSNSTKFVSNWWSPSQSIGFLLENAQNAKGTPSYVFFENREGMVFVSLETLYTAKPIGKFIKDQYIREFKADGTTQRNIGEEYSRIQTFFVPELYNYLDRLQSGFYSSNLTTYDLTTKKYGFHTFDAAKESASYERLNPVAPFSDTSVYRSNALRLYCPKYYGNFNGYSDVTDSDGVQRRVSLLKQAEAFKVQMSVFGRVDYTVGRVVELEIYKNRPVRDTDAGDSIVDKVLSGKYLISAIAHVITREGHVCNMELIKDSILIIK